MCLISEKKALQVTLEWPQYKPSHCLQKKKGGWPKGKRRKKARDMNAPKQPLTGYVRFLNDRRDKVRADNPALSFSEITKLLGAEWSRLQQHEKQVVIGCITLCYSICCVCLVVFAV